MIRHILRHLFNFALQSPTQTANHHDPSIVSFANPEKYGGIRSWLNDLIPELKANNFSIKHKTRTLHFSAIKRYSARLILIHYPSNWRNLFFLALLKWFNPKTTFVLIEHHYSEELALQITNRRRFYKMLKLNYSLFNHVIVNSHPQRDWLLTQKLLPAEKLITLPVCRNDSALLKLGKKPRQSKLIIGAYGRLEEGKGFSKLIQDFIAINKSNLQLLIGGTGRLHSQLMTRAQDTSNIEFVGKVHDAQQFLSRCDLIIVPSRYETFGLTCLEAKMAGKCIISAKVGGLKDQVIEGETGFFFTHQNPQSLVNILSELHTYPIQQMGEQARTTVKNSWQKHVEQWCYFLDYIAQQHQPTHSTVQSNNHRLPSNEHHSR